MKRKILILFSLLIGLAFVVTVGYLFYNYNSQKPIKIRDKSELNLDSGTSYSCNDSDGGIIYNTKGTIIMVPVGAGKGVKYEDYCVNENTLRENLCSPLDKQPTFEDYVCAGGCVDGACVFLPDSKKCMDSDGGKNYDEKGGVTGGYLDRCEPNGLLKEYFCQDSGEEGFERYNCPKGCLDGVCLK